MKSNKRNTHLSPWCASERVLRGLCMFFFFGGWKERAMPNWLEKKMELCVGEEMALNHQKQRVKTCEAKKEKTRTIRRVTKKKRLTFIRKERKLNSAFYVTCLNFWACGKKSHIQMRAVAIFFTTKFWSLFCPYANLKTLLEEETEQWVVPLNGLTVNHRLPLISGYPNSKAWFHKWETHGVIGATQAYTHGESVNIMLLLITTWAQRLRLHRFDMRQTN